MDSSSDFVVVANRLPVDRRVDRDGTVSWTPSPGGLVTALRPVLEEHSGAWIGWPGTTTAEDEEPVTTADLPHDNGVTLVPVALSPEDHEAFYEGFSNATLWPLYHDLIVHPEYRPDWWERYVTVNRRFADAAAAEAAEGATVWVQDYQLHLVPGMIRQMRPDVRIGFFLHIPFPAPELFRQLPWRRQVLESTLGADVIGFHTPDSASNFLLTLRALGHDVTVEPEIGDGATFIRGARLPEGSPAAGTVEVDGRTVTVGVFPISIDSAQVNTKANTPESIAAAMSLRQRLGSPKILIAGVDRMDYTKGILHRLEALEMLLDNGDLRADDVCLVQVATPSRERLESYKQTRKLAEQTVSRINGNHGSLGHTVVHYTHAGLPFDEVVALYSAADVMLVTALKDGMNLVAKEYVACHSDGSGALVLSEFTGAATQLTDAYLCNPHDRESVGEALLDAVRSPAVERRRRMSAMWEQVRTHDVHRWAREFLEVLG
ncbi:trehalose-6-phosphate synthase [Corynebacterium bovis]|uniref:alpha,alpha-trehalose-phosphate synthase (UDP-forming) n=1 Tax=Corynebacterium bovis TaxID=36808 RepID=UPI0031388D97